MNKDVSGLIERYLIPKKFWFVYEIDAFDKKKIKKKIVFVSETKETATTYIIDRLAPNDTIS